MQRLILLWLMLAAAVSMVVAWQMAFGSKPQEAAPKTVEENAEPPAAEAEAIAESSRPLTYVNDEPLQYYFDIHPDLPMFRFDLIPGHVEFAHDGTALTAKEIVEDTLNVLVQTPNGYEQIQTIESSGLFFGLEKRMEDEAVEASRDFNFDGYHDLELTGHGSASNAMRQLWLFEPAMRTFEFAFADLGFLDPDPEREVLLFYANTGGVSGGIGGEKVWTDTGELVTTRLEQWDSTKVYNGYTRKRMIEELQEGTMVTTCSMLLGEDQYCLMEGTWGACETSRFPPPWEENLARLEQAKGECP